MDVIIELKDILDVEDLDETVQLDSLSEWDSLAKLSFVASVKANCGISINAEELNRCSSVGDLVNLTK